MTETTGNYNIAKTDNWNYEDLYHLKDEIDTLLDRAGHDDEEFWLEQVKQRLRSVVLDLGIYREILKQYSESPSRKTLSELIDIASADNPPQLLEPPQKIVKPE